MKNKKFLIFSFVVSLGVFSASKNVSSAEYCLFLDSSGSEHWVMANDCGTIISDSNCASGSSVASCPNGNAHTNCVANISPLEQYLLEDRLESESNNSDDEVEKMTRR